MNDKQKSRADVGSTELLACSEPMLCAAMREAVDRRMLPECDFVDTAAKNWADMRACIDAALSQANAPCDCSAFIAEVERIANDYIPYDESQVPLALSEMREALQSLLADTSIPDKSAESVCSPWPPRDVVAKLVDSADILLDDNDCTDHGWDLIYCARSHAREWLEQQNTTIHDKSEKRTN